ncbi:MAG TPA: hypothetical protein VLA66_04395, partial [Thermoanaerobaculia bacterium]|nr:hypothetical protein [Thermoanaerobaculia bacterium]
CFQAHKGAVQSRDRNERARRRGLLEVGALSADRLDVVSVRSGERRSYPLFASSSAASAPETAGPDAASCLEEIRTALDHGTLDAPPELDAESVERLRSLGSLD